MTSIIDPKQSKDDEVSAIGSSTRDITKPEEPSSDSATANRKPPDPNKSRTKVELQLPYRPKVTAGWKIPGIATYKVGQWTAMAREVNQWEDHRQGLSNQQLRKEFLSLVYRAKSGEPLESLLPETYSLVREAGRRALNMRHYDVQILGGVFLFNGCIAEMQTGEGKNSYCHASANPSLVGR